MIMQSNRDRVGSPQRPTADPGPVARTATAGAAHGARALRHAVRRHSRHLLIALVLLASVTVAALVRSAGAPAAATDDARGRIVDSVAGLLVHQAPNPGVAGQPAPPTSPDAGALPAEPDAGAPAQVRPNVMAEGSATVPQGTDPAIALAPLRDFARTGSRPDLRSLAALTAAEQAVLVTGDLPRNVAASPALAAGRAPQMPARIPDAIEGTTTFAARDADALAPYTVSAALRILEEDAPIVLQEVRQDAGPARARFGARPGSATTAVPTGWMELGDSPMPGWRIIRIQAQAVLLMTPLGNPVRLTTWHTPSAQTPGHAQDVAQAARAGY